MKITFDLKAKIFVPDADYAPKKETIEKMLAHLLRDEGMHVKSLSVENYSVSDQKGEEEENDTV